MSLLRAPHSLLVLTKCSGSAWAFRCQLWLWNSLLKNVRRYSWALIDFCGTKVKHELTALPLTNCLLHSAKHKQVFYSAGSGEDLSTMLKGNHKAWVEEKWSFRGGYVWKPVQGSSVSQGCLWSPPAVHVRAQLFQLSQHPSYSCCCKTSSPFH